MQEATTRVRSLRVTRYASRVMRRRASPDRHRDHVRLAAAVREPATAIDARRVPELTVVNVHPRLDLLAAAVAVRALAFGDPRRDAPLTAKDRPLRIAGVVALVRVQPQPDVRRADGNQLSAHDA